jgi:hypothetical protein
MLEPIEGLDFYPQWHRYRYQGQWMTRSVTGVLAEELSPYARRKIEETKHGPDGWEIRGKTIHAALEQHLLGEAAANPGDFGDWIDPLLSCWLFQGSETLAVEYTLCDVRKQVAGCFDFLVRTAKGSLVLGDLKTVKNAPAARSRKPAEAQLGAYAAMLIDHHPHLTIDKCVTVVAGPGVCEVKPSDPSECIAKWLDAWDAYQLLQPDF